VLNAGNLNHRFKAFVQVFICSRDVSAMNEHRGILGLCTHADVRAHTTRIRGQWSELGDMMPRICFLQVQDPFSRGIVHKPFVVR
jgi:hypothetical protein